MQDTLIYQDDIIEINSLNKKSSFSPQKIQNLRFSSIKETWEIVYPITHRKDEVEGSYKTEFLDDDRYNLDIEHFLGFSFSHVKDKVENILENKADTLKEHLLKKENWEFIIIQWDPITKESEEKNVIRVYWRPVRQVFDKIFYTTKKDTNEKEREKLSLDKNTRNFVEHFTFSIGYILEPLEQWEELKKVEDFSFDTSRKIIQKKKAEKKDIHKYDFKNMLSSFSPLEKKEFQGTQEEYKNHIIWLAEKLISSFKDILKNRGKSYQNDFHTESTSWFDNISLEEREKIIQNIIPKYLEILSWYPSEWEMTPREVLVHSWKNTLNTGDTIGWDIFSIESLITRTLADNSDILWLIHFIEHIRWANNKTQRNIEDHPEQWYDIWSTNKVIRRAMIWIRENIKKYGIYGTDIKKVFSEYVFKIFEEDLYLTAGMHKNTSTKERLTFLKGFMSFWSKKFDELVENHSSLLLLKEIINTITTLWKLQWISPSQYGNILVLLKKYFLYGIEDEKDRTKLLKILNSSKFRYKINQASKGKVKQN